MNSSGILASIQSTSLDTTGAEAPLVARSSYPKQAMAISDAAAIQATAMFTIAST